MALVGRLVLLEYDVAGPRVWHERRVLEWVSDLQVVELPAASYGSRNTLQDGAMG